jgi:hypothetical protein
MEKNLIGRATMNLKAVALSGIILASGVSLAKAQNAPQPLPLAPHERLQPDILPWYGKYVELFRRILEVLNTDGQGQ